MGLLGRIVKKKWEKLFEEKPVSYWPKRNFPLFIYPNARLSFDQSIFIIAGRQLEVPPPYEGNWTVKAIGIFTFLEEEHLRFYLEDFSKNEMVLEISGEGEEMEIIFLKSADERFPKDAEEVDIWMNKNEGLIGYIAFNSYPNGTRYDRIFQNPGPDHIDPFEITETIYTEKGIFEIQHEMMVLGRQVFYQEEAEPISEILIASKDTDDEGSMIQIYKGIYLTSAQITVI